MKNLLKIALCALTLSGAALATAEPADAAVSFGFEFGAPYPRPYYRPFPPPAPRCYDPYYYDYCSYPTFYGPVFWGGYWFNGPLRYRDFHGRREYWIHNGWHEGRARDGFRGGARGGFHHR